MTIPAGAQRVAFRYDYLGRRIWKQVQTYQNNEWVVTDTRKFVWDGWRMLVELRENAGSDVLDKAYTWGLDLAGQGDWLVARDRVPVPFLGAAGFSPRGGVDAGYGGNGADRSRDREGAEFLQAAGGIGGLLAMEDPGDPNDPNDNLNYVYMYDANGNVGQLVDWAHDPNDPNGAIVARYEYDPYGNVTAKSGSYADENPFRFSTKSFDVETGLSYFGGRYYNAALGRWLNRDPIEELGGVNLCAYARNDPADNVDPFGQAVCMPGWSCWPKFYYDDYHHCPRPRPVKPVLAQYGGVGGLTQQQFAPQPPPRRRYTKPYAPCPAGQTRPDLGNGYRGTCRTPNNQGATTNGCSFSPDAPAGFDFKPGCNEHDRCYATLGKTKQQCDDELLKDLLRICISYPSQDQRERCFGWARRYYWGVQKFGTGAYDDAQREAADQEAHDAEKRQGLIIDVGGGIEVIDWGRALGG